MEHTDPNKMNDRQETAWAGLVVFPFFVLQGDHITRIVDGDAGHFFVAELFRAQWAYLVTHSLLARANVGRVRGREGGRKICNKQLNQTK